ncbi:hypothetical protein [Acuticoccus kandeliae]|uniref:hypothetical protein n=1 Tax=Acuticoccus kandeliae TaxID=2073160 RepID=UPI0013006542|nr:hypothetical protein [Acuticoccus kandeliae]
MTDRSEHAGIAALAICESLLLCLRDEGVLQWQTVNDLLEDAASMYDKEALEHPEAAARHTATAQIIRSMLLENSVKI